MRHEARRFFAAAVALLLLTVAPQVVFADHHEAPAPGYTVIHFDEVGPANMMAYEENAKAWVAAFAEAKMGAEWGWRTYSGPNFNYVFLTEIPNYAYLDKVDEQDAAMVAAIGEDKIKALSADGGGSTGHWHELTKDLPELSYMPEGGVGEGGFVHLSTHSVRPGKGEEFKALLAEVTAARKKVGSKMAVFASQIEFGEGSYQFATVAKDAAAYYAAPGTGEVLTEAYGAERSQAMFAEWRAIVTDYETSNWNFEPELSYMPGMADEAMMDKGEGSSE